MDLGFLSPVIDRPGPWTTVWTDVSYDTQDAAHRRELSARGIRERLHTQGADQAGRDAIYDTLAATPPPGVPGSHTGRYLLANAGEVVCDLTLAGPPARSGEAWAALPRLTPLLGGLAEDTPCLVAYVDRTGVDLEVRGEGTSRTTVRAEGRAGPARRTGRDAWRGRHHDLKAEDAWEDSAHEVAHVIEDAWDDSGARVLLLAGGARERHAVRDLLPRPIAEVASETEHGGRAAGSVNRLVERDVAEARAAFENARTRRDVDRARANDSAVASDLPSLLGAAREHRIEALMVHPQGAGLGREVWVGPEPDQLAMRGNELAAFGERSAQPARADDALLRACAATGARVVPVPDPTQAPIGGFGAILRGDEPGDEPAGS